MLNLTDMKLRRRLGRAPLAALWLSMGSTAIAELAVAHTDAVVIDMQHGLWDRIGLESVVGLIGDNAPVLVRVAENTPTAIGQALDSGAEGIIVPLIESGGEAALAVGAARFPPQGRRSGGGVRPLAGDFLAYCAIANERTVVGVMIETKRGIDNAAEIARTPGLDFILIGTGDLSLSLGLSPEAANRHEDGCRAVLAACRTAGIACAIYTASTAQAVARSREGYAMVIAANDISVVVDGFKNAALQFKEGVAQGDPSSRDPT
ncbi:MAG: aldolase/citrate lyase family protein [Pseudolabrys sp.]